MTALNALIGRHPVLAYYAVTFAISWAGVHLIIGGPGHLPGTPEQTTALLPAVYLATVAGPALASIVLTGLVSGREGFGELGARLLRWRVDARWYAVALRTAPLSGASS